MSKINISEKMLNLYFSYFFSYGFVATIWTEDERYRLGVCFFFLFNINVKWILRYHLLISLNRTIGARLVYKRMGAACSKRQFDDRASALVINYRHNIVRIERILQQLQWTD